jgi:hypothetical protein
MNTPKMGTGANPSSYDSRTHQHDTATSYSIPTVGGIIYTPEDITSQHAVGICTGISLTQNASKALGKKFSADFQYLCQKKFYDLDWDEGSSIFSALKVGNKIGFLPVDLFKDLNGNSYITESDRELLYPQYILKLQNISYEEVQRLITLCTDKLSGYAKLSTDSLSLAKGILDSQSGILCRYSTDLAWWTARDGRTSWATVDIDPIRPPKVPTSGHAIGKTYFDFTINKMFLNPNTWGTDWDDQLKGNCNIDDDVYKCTEAWIPYYGITPTPLPPQFIFTTDMKYGQTSEDVRRLQLRLISLGYSIPAGATKFYGTQTKSAVYQYQLNNIPLTWYERYFLRGSLCGPKTRTELNKIR